MPNQNRIDKLVDVLKVPPGQVTVRVLPGAVRFVVPGNKAS
jgi:hypothetical protein